MGARGTVRRALLVAGLALAWPGTSPAARDRPASPRPDRDRPPSIVLFLVDDLGAGDLGCYGDGYQRTPAIDGLAAGGALFTDAYAAAPVCSPSRASLLTGASPARLRITDWIPGMRYPRARLLVPDFDQELPLERVTLAERLRERGYATWHVGKWHLGGEGFWPLEQGFDVNLGGHSKGHPGSYHFPYGRGGDHEVRNLPPGGAAGDHLTDRLTELALELLDRHAADAPERPFFLHLSYYAVHTPVEPRADRLADCAARRALDTAWAGRDPGYAALVGGVDASVGRILERLERHGWEDHTLVVLTSDNGGYLGLARMAGPAGAEPLRAGKGFLYEGGIRVPLLVRWPGVVAPGSRVTAPAIGTDLFPTLVEAGGGEAAAEDGASLVPWLRGDGPAGERSLFWHYPHYHTRGRYPCGAVRAGRHKLIEWYEDGRLELFDLAADPREQHDLAASEPERAAALRARLEGWLDRVGAQRPRPNPDHDPDEPFADGRTAWGAVTPGR